MAVVSFTDCGHHFLDHYNKCRLIQATLLWKHVFFRLTLIWLLFGYFLYKTLHFLPFAMFGANRSNWSSGVQIP